MHETARQLRSHRYIWVNQQHIFCAYLIIEISWVVFRDASNASENSRFFIFSQRKYSLFCLFVISEFSLKYIFQVVFPLCISLFYYYIGCWSSRLKKGKRNFFKFKFRCILSFLNSFDAIINCIKHTYHTVCIK